MLWSCFSAPDAPVDAVMVSESAFRVRVPWESGDESSEGVTGGLLRVLFQITSFVRACIFNLSTGRSTKPRLGISF